MKKIIKTITLVILFTAILWIGSDIECHYSRQAEVIEVNGNRVTVEDTCGYFWQFKGENFQEGQSVKLKMFDNHTVTITDDEIVKVKK